MSELNCSDYFLSPCSFYTSMMRGNKGAFRDSQKGISEKKNMSPEHFVLKCCEINN